MQNERARRVHREMRCPLDVGPSRSKLINTENSILTSVDRCGEEPVPLERTIAVPIANDTSRAERATPSEDGNKVRTEARVKFGNVWEERTRRTVRKFRERRESMNPPESLRLRATGRRRQALEQASRRVAACRGAARHGTARRGASPSESSRRGWPMPTTKARRRASLGPCAGRSCTWALARYGRARCKTHAAATRTERSDARVPSGLDATARDRHGQIEPIFEPPSIGILEN